jgi:hypothetical protein
LFAGDTGSHDRFEHNPKALGDNHQSVNDNATGLQNGHMPLNSKMGLAIFRVSVRYGPSQSVASPAR